MVLGDKDALRRALRARRDALALDARSDGSRRIASYALAFVPPVCSRVALYAAVGSEVDTEPLFSALRDRQTEVYLPRCRGNMLEFAVTATLESLLRGNYGIPEPDGPATDIATFDAVIVPGLGFDRSGARLGYGKGYYDRALQGYRGLVIGLAFSVQVVDALPTTTHDRLVDRVITEVGAL